MTEKQNIKEKTLFEISKKSLLTLENLLNSDQIEIPVKISDLLDIAIGSIVESEIVDQINLINILVEEPELLYDVIEFEESSKYNLHDIISQIICFRLIVLMKQFLDHIEIECQNTEKITEVENKAYNN